ncbi:PREDICTED: adenosine deaminase-like protein [Dufourea novaeangliae]|uniref:Adenosine deaminase-like protein n=1 Tax=Dufourea novaeangliae TaxID=178035 RepID=A0A154NXL3_DUFNO|nr:PREDICTED: adenosine deaminase-like protein [Dufourea novaeangliae]KZC04415.1 Adenosine deaminase-like protein [Dufourea novaeangliae]
MSIKNFCKSLPKVELHAHLNGSLSPDTLKKLYKMQNPTSEDCENIVMSTEKYSSLGECFKVFDVAHSLTVTPEAVFQSTYDVIKEFQEDNVIYLELRSTPRAINGQMTKQEYIEAIIKAFQVCKTDFPDIMVKLLISINRKQGYKAAEENIQLAIHYFKKYPQCVVGLDLSGDPMAGDAFLELLKKARNAGLKIAAHCAEISNEIETKDILEFKPDRLGHCTCIHPNLQGSDKLFDMLIKSKIPVELCLTSNVQCKTVPSYGSHQFKYLYEAGHPISLCTDDKGVFHTSLSKEYELASSTFDLGREELVKLCMLSVQYAFTTEEEKKLLLSRIEDFNHESKF